MTGGERKGTKRENLNCQNLSRAIKTLVANSVVSSQIDCETSENTMTQQPDVIKHQKEKREREETKPGRITPLENKGESQDVGIGGVGGWIWCH